MSRLEDPSYGRMSVKTLLDLSRVFDTGLRVQFVSLISMLHKTFKPKAHLREVPSFEEEAPHVGFYTPSKGLIESDGVQPASVVMLGKSSVALPIMAHRTMLSFPMPRTTYLDETLEVAT